MATESDSTISDSPQSQNLHAPQCARDAQHTPGPWLLTPEYDLRHYSREIVWSSKGPGWGAIATVDKTFTAYKANVLLIAAAPELLKAALELYSSSRLEPVGKRWR